MGGTVIPTNRPKCLPQTRGRRRRRRNLRVAFLRQGRQSNPRQDPRQCPLEPFPRLCPPRTCPHQDPQLQPLPRQLAPLLPRMGGGSTGSSSSSRSGGGVDAASLGIIGGVVAGAAVLFIMAMVVYRNKSRDEQASLADDVDRITIEAEAARPQPTPVDQASMSSGVNDMSMVEAPASMVTDVQEKIIEADL